MPVRRSDATAPAAPKAAAPTPAPLKNARFEGITTALRVGSKGPAVRAVQEALIDMGFALPGGADGEFGPQTEKAVRNFQTHASATQKKVKVNGAVDGATLRALDALAPPPGKKGERGLPQLSSYDGKPIRALVVKAEHRTFLFNGKGEITDIFPNAVGAASTPTDSGLKKVTGKLDAQGAADLGRRLWGDPSVYGPRLIDLSWADGRPSGEELHGTNAPHDLGEDVSHGCMRHHNQDILKLYESLKLGDRVAVVDWLADPHLGPRK